MSVINLSIQDQIHQKLIVSCQAREGEPFRAPAFMAQFALSAVMAGAAAIRTQGAEDIRAIRSITGLPIMGIRKLRVSDNRVLITPTFESAQELAEAGADMIALDVTSRGQRYGAIERMQQIKSELAMIVCADIATVEEAQEAADAGADFVLSTMRGYTDDTAHVKSFDPDFIEALVKHAGVPVIAEGKIETPAQARAALDAGAFSVVVGSAITRPITIARRFVEAISQETRHGNS